PSTHSLTSTLFPYTTLFRSFGSWLLVAPIALAILRRPSVGVLAEMLAAIIEVVFLGNPVGPLLVLSAALQGIGSELPFALTRYRDRKSTRLNSSHVSISYAV